MGKYDPNDPAPPCYSNDVDIEHPSKPSKGETGPGLYYISKDPLPVVAPQITQLSKCSGSQTKKRCKSNARYYAGLGVLLLVALLMLTIWLGIRFGTRLVPVEIPIDHVDDDNEARTAEIVPSVVKDTCSSNAIQCDGIEDCSLGTDETTCVRFGLNNLEVKTTQDLRFLPVCYKGWNKHYADKTCAQLGFGQSFLSKVQTLDNSIGLVLTDESSSFIQGGLTVSSSCPQNELVSLKCVECGQRMPTSKIVGGQAAKPGDWPWHMPLLYKYKPACGAALISSNYLVTAGHCFRSFRNEKKYWTVHPVLDSKINLHETYYVKEIIVHENYNDSTLDNDIALIKLNSSVENLQPICLPPTGKEFQAGTKCWTTGFGATNEHHSSQVLMEVDVEIIDHTMCKNMYEYTITESMICAGYEEGVKDACQGDSGGPLVSGDNVWNLVGVTSWGVGCGLKSKPGVYTSVSRFLPWIYHTMQHNGL
ncbi:transmembrane protease serine 13a [Antennarius striatus]|uniref:transmembrane protease serine 13a n=1 Tax=Antennarius striatus TaxID=241820 RepID=UPI0035B4A7F0